jgi:site-specific recombinase XerD
MNEIINQFQTYLKNKPLCMLTIRGYVFDVAQFMKWAESNSILFIQATPENAGQYLNYLVTSRHAIRPGVVGTYSPRTIMKKIAAMRSFYDFLRAGNG